MISQQYVQDYNKAKNIKEMAVCLDKNILTITSNNGHYLCMDAKNLIEYQESKRNITKNNNITNNSNNEKSMLK